MAVDFKPGVPIPYSADNLAAAKAHIAKTAEKDAIFVDKKAHTITILPQDSLKLLAAKSSNAGIAPDNELFACLFEDAPVKAKGSEEKAVFRMSITGEKGKDLAGTKSAGGLTTTKGTVNTMDGTARRMLVALGVLDRDGKVVSEAAKKSGLTTDQKAINRVFYVALTGDGAHENGKQATRELPRDGKEFVKLVEDQGLLVGRHKDGTWRLNGNAVNEKELLAIYKAQFEANPELIAQFDKLLGDTFALPEGQKLKDGLPAGKGPVQMGGVSYERALQIAAVFMMGLNFNKTEKEVNGDASHLDFSQNDLKKLGADPQKTGKTFVDTGSGLTKGIDDNLEGFYTLSAPSDGQSTNTDTAVLPPPALDKTQEVSVAPAPIPLNAKDHIKGGPKVAQGNPDKVIAKLNPEVITVKAPPTKVPMLPYPDIPALPHVDVDASHRRYAKDQASFLEDYAAKLRKEGRKNDAAQLDALISKLLAVKTAVDYRAAYKEADTVIGKINQ